MKDELLKKVLSGIGIAGLLAGGGSIEQFCGIGLHREDWMYRAKAGADRLSFESFRRAQFPAELRRIIL